MSPRGIPDKATIMTDNKRILWTRAAVAAMVVVAVLLADQLTKIWVKTHLCLYERIPVMGDWFQIYFTENRGMAFGMDFVGTLPLTLFRLVAVGAFLYYLTRRLRAADCGMGLIVCLAMVIAGAAGNIVDNCVYGLMFTESLPVGYIFSEPATMTAWGEGYGHFLQGRVVDMLYFPMWTWPESWPIIGGDVFFGAVFNVADASICVGAACLLLFHRRMFFNHEVQEAE